jgi:hypothetical protein
MSDLTVHLREGDKVLRAASPTYLTNPVMAEAADEIERLETVRNAALNLVIDIRDQWGSLPDERLVKALESALAAKGDEHE